MLARISLLALVPFALAAQTVNATKVGHEFREDDSPTLAVCPDGTAWVGWLSFVGDRDDVAIRQWKDGKWGALQWVPGNEGDNWLPQVGCDARNRVSAVWSQQVAGNWDIYSRRFDPATQEWAPLEKLSTDPMPDINPRLAADGKGRFAVAWQAFRNGHSNIFLKTFDGEKWSSEIRVTSTQANDWEPAAAYDQTGGLWLAYDSYRRGNYDIFAAHVVDGRVQGGETAITSGASFDARATVAVDSANRVWIAWEEGRPNWGKDQGYSIRDIQTGAPLGGIRKPRIRCLTGGAWKTTAVDISDAFPKGNTYQPHVFSDARGSVWVVAKTRFQGQPPAGNGGGEGGGGRGYWEYWLTHFDGSTWSKAVALPESKGRSSTRAGGVTLSDGTLLLSWSTDSRNDKFYHRPLRQLVYVGMVKAPAAPSGARFAEPVAVNSAELQPTHPNEVADLQSIRSYRIDGLRIVRGDFHRHTELSWDGGGAADGNLQDFYRYMIDCASMDFGASTDHQGGAWPYWWWYTQKMTDMYHVPGVYTPIFGYERSAIFPNGHRNVFYATRAESRVTPFHLKAGADTFGIPAPPIGDEPGVGTGELVANDTKLLYEEVRARRGITIPHTSGTRMGTDWRDNSPDLEPVVEIFQGARTNYEELGAPLAANPVKDAQHIGNAGFQPSGMVVNAWAKGYKLGIITSSDHGSTHISYALVLTADTSRQGVLDAIRKRHTYGAMDNIIMDVHMGAHLMGDEFELKKAQPIRVKVRGTEAVDQVNIIKDGKVIYTSSPQQRNVSFEFTDTGDIAGRHYYYVRVQQQNRLLAWSSPFFVNYQ